ncbi:hypothetical protein CJU94_18045 [Paraburkholderia aromaticivorans]|uniref:Uncharacterized protein n=2 Tax=Paraburkholderia aromaticivorans TaxID=2026199 RepID=A0A248VLI2_9BURK|nr:hypothetical protein CJU94_18045 [Paraburkholderia aromaticivorans]
MTASISGMAARDSANAGNDLRQPDETAAQSAEPRSPIIPSRDPVSPSVSTPFSNSLNFKTGLLLSTWNTWQDRPPLPGSSSFSSRLIAANRMGHAANGMASNLGRFFSSLGKTLDPYDSQKPTLAALQAGKALGNAIGYAVDFSKVEDKRATARNYLSGPLRQGAFSLLPERDPHEEIMLVRFRASSTSTQSQTAAPRTGDRVTQTMGPLHQSHGTQTHSPATSRDRRTQTDGSRISRTTQTPVFTQGRFSQTDSNQAEERQARADGEDKKEAGNRPASNDAGTQTDKQRVHEATQTRRDARDAEVQTDSPGTTDNGSQATPQLADAGTQNRVHVKHQNVYAGPAGQVDESVQAIARTDHSETQTSHYRHDRSVQTADRRRIGTAVQAAPFTSTAATQTATVKRDADVQAVPPNPDRSVSRNPGAAPGTGQPTQPDARQRIHGHDAGSQAGWPQTDRESQANVETRQRATQKSPPITDHHGSQTAVIQRDQDSQAAPPSRSRSVQAEVVTTSFNPPETTQKVLPDSVKANGHWLPIDLLALASSSANVKNDSNTANRMSLVADSFSTTGDAVAVANIDGSKLLTLSSKALSLLGTAVGLAPSVGQLSSDIKELIRNPGNEQAKWNVGNDSVQLIGGLVATAASFAFPPAALAPLLLPNFAEIYHAEALRKSVDDLRAQGLDAEAGALHTEYQKAVLNATPVVNWFSSFYTPAMRPAIERFELSQGNKPGAAPMGDIGSGTRGDPAVLDYYGQAMQQRGKRLATSATPYLKAIAQEAGADSVTMVSHAPQVFGWPSTGQPMRLFDRSIAMTYSRESGVVSYQFFGKERDGIFRLAMLNEGVTTGHGKKNLVVVDNMLDPDKQRVKFDLQAYRGDQTGTIYLADRNRYAI